MAAGGAVWNRTRTPLQRKQDHANRRTSDQMASPVTYLPRNMTVSEAINKTAWRGFVAACAAFSETCDIELVRDSRGVRVNAYLSDDEYTLDLDLLADAFGVRQMPAFCDGQLELWSSESGWPVQYAGPVKIGAVSDLFIAVAEREPHANITLIRSETQLRLTMKLESEPFTFDLPALRDLLRRHDLPTTLSYSREDGIVLFEQTRDADQ